jgi:GT2 family glycosyltransferase
MTINCNVLERNLFLSIGGVPDDYSGNYNDVALAENLHKLGRIILLAPTRVCHLGRMTLASGTNVRLEEDKKKYFAAYPERFNKNPVTWDIRLSFFFQSKGLRVLASAIERLPDSPIKRLFSKLMFSLSHSV